MQQADDGVTRHALAPLRRTATPMPRARCPRTTTIATASAARDGEMRQRRQRRDRRQRQ